MRLFVFALLFLSLAHAEFVFREVEVSISDIKKDGSVHVKESIRFLVIGDYEKALYESGFDKNDLTFWANITGLHDVKLHLDPNRVDIPETEFALRPQPLRECNAALNLCQGQLILEYTAYPHYNRTNDEPLPGTGIFSIEHPKPRVTRYSINHQAFAFARTEQGDLRLGEDVHLVVNLVPGAHIENDADLNPKPNDLQDASFPLQVQRLEWRNLVLVKFTVIFTVEESLDQEVVEFFSEVFKVLEQQLRGEQGIATILIFIILLGGYLYLQKSKRRGA